MAVSRPTLTSLFRTILSARIDYLCDFALREKRPVAAKFIDAFSEGYGDMPEGILVARHKQSHQEAT